jgi:hypothetical protein
MKRIELFEFEDFAWLPKVIRTGVTNLILVFHKMLGTSEVLAEMLHQIRQKHPFSQITDLGAGSGGAMLKAVEKLNQKYPASPVKLVLTDLYPHPGIVQQINGQNDPQLSYHPESVNASNLQDAPEGLKTMIASFHHMSPPTARKILSSAQENQEPLFIFEIAKNTIPVFLWWLLLPISLTFLFVMVLFMTPFVRPLSFQQFLFTYLIPIIPLVYAWDGQASLMRTYTFEDFRELIGSHDHPEYTWAIEDATKPDGKKLGYYILGFPKRK